MEDQRRFAVMGENLFKILIKLFQNQRLCRLLKYQAPDPFDKEKYPNVNGQELLHKQINIIPKYPEDGIEYSYIVVVFDNFSVNPNNASFKISQIRFDVVAPYTEWIVDGDNLRPYLIMQEIDNMFNQAKLSGIGKLQFVRSTPLTLSPQIGGYSMYYQINEFN